MTEIPSMDDILKRGRARERRVELVLGVVLVAGGLAFRFGLRMMVGPGVDLWSYAAIALGTGLIGRALSARS